MANGGGGRVTVGGGSGGAPSAAAAPPTLRADVRVDPRKGMWTLEEVVAMLRDVGLQIALEHVGGKGWRAP